MKARHRQRRHARRLAHAAFCKARGVVTIPDAGWWDQIKTDAKRRKKSVAVVAKAQGLVLAGEDPKQRESWRVA